MKRTAPVTAVIAALLITSGCKSTPPPAPVASPAKPVTTPAAPPVVLGSDAQRKADENLWREVEKKKRKSKSANLNKTKAYQNYIP